MRFENTIVYNMKEAIRAARYSFSSEDASDTKETGGVVEIGAKDRELVEKLVNAGSSHRKFMRAIFLSVDITAPRYWWTQFDTYKVGVTAISESTMHTIMKKPFAFEDFGFVEDGINSITEHEIVKNIEYIRQSGAFERLIRMLPQGYKQKRHVAMNYEVVRNICCQRRGHKLKEWQAFIEWAATLPHADIFLEG